MRVEIRDLRFPRSQEGHSVLARLSKNETSNALMIVLLKFKVTTIATLWSKSTRWGGIGWDESLTSFLGARVVGETPK